MYRLVISIFLLAISFILVPNAHAVTHEYITIVNPVRISEYTKNPVLSLQAEYAQIDDRNLPATWLLTYDVLKNREMIQAFKDFNSDQEFGIFLEVSADFADDSKVVYNKTNSWHRATSLFLSGYTQKERKIMIDNVFSKFKKTFGKYPKSVGAWWVDSYSLEYMQEKYKITGFLGVADQYDLDGYQVWGTPYSTVYFPSKLNAASPASSVQNQLKIVAYRWAARDPLNGYLSPSKAQASLYSIQDYNKNNLDLTYYKSLTNLYSEASVLNDFAQITVGLESDYVPETYKGQYSDWMDDVVELQASGRVVTTMSQFSDWYRSKFKITPTTVIKSHDLLGTSKEIIWINNKLYRIGIVSSEKETEVIDFRVYPDNFIEPYYLSPNKEFNLSIDLPYIIDSVIDPESSWKLGSGKLISTSKKGDIIQLKFEKGEMTFSNNSITFLGIKIPDVIKKSEQVSIDKNNIVSLVSKYPVDQKGIVFSDFTPRVPFAIKHRIERYENLIGVGTLILLLIVLIFFRKKINNKHIYFAVLALMIGALIYLFIQLNNKHYVSQTEYDAISVLKRFPEGNVLVYDKDCLKCQFESKYKPAAAEGIKGYVEKYSGQETIYDYDFHTAETSQIAKDVLKRKNIKYIYITRYESYIETLPYIPEDLGLKRIYENANVQIWQVL